MIMAGIQPGHMAYMEYLGYPGVVHARLILAHVAGHDWVIATPDGHVYTETLDSSNADLSHFWHVAGGALPRGVRGENVYAFAPMSAAIYAQYMADGRQEALDEQARRGVVVPPPAPRAGEGPVGDAVDPGRHESDEIWVLAEWIDGHLIGEEVTPTAGAISDGKRCFVHVADKDGKDHTLVAARISKDELDSFCEERIRIARESVSKHGDDTVAAEDVRTMSIKYGQNGERSRSFKESVQEMRMTEFDDWPLVPRTTQEYLKAVLEISESCYGQHLAWVQQAKIPEGDRAIYEDEVLSKVVDMAVKFDGLNIVNLACFEMICRRKQLLAEAHVGNPSAPSYEAADYFMGQRFRPGGGIVIPSLTAQVSSRMHEESQILKEKRKLIEAKGKGKGKPPAPDTSGGGLKK